MESYDVLIVGGGPAGLSAALILGRCRRRVCVVDAGNPRNERAHAAHGVFTRDGVSPAELRRTGREQLAPYDVTIYSDEVVEVAPPSEAGGVFVAKTRDGRVLDGKKLLLATGMRDVVPDRPGLRELFGRGVYVCPYCDGWEHRDQRLVAYAPAEGGPDLALALLTWSSDVVLVIPDGAAQITAETRDRLERHRIVVRDEDIARVESTDGSLRAIVLDSGARIERDAIFVKFGEEQASSLVHALGCDVGPQGTVCPGDGERAGPPGVFVAGDASHDLQLVSIAVAEGVKAGCAINTELRKGSQR